MSVLYLRNKETNKFEPVQTINGVTPHIGDNGNWWIGEADTGKPSRGTQGENGKPGMFTFHIDEMVHLILTHQAYEDIPDFSINSAGHLIVTI